MNIMDHMTHNELEGTQAPILPKVSDANHWMTCHGSVRAQLMYPGVPGEVSDSRKEGRACHEAASAMLKTWQEDQQAEPPYMVGQLSRDGVVITQELYDAAMEYVTNVINYCAEHELAPNTLHIEERVDLSHMLTGWYGIADAWIYNPKLATLVVWEFKGGHALVEAYEHWPMLLYSVGITEKIPYIQHYEYRVVQPRGFHRLGIVRDWKLERIALDVFRHRVSKTLPLVLDEEPLCVVSSHCKDCTARANCDTILRVGYEGVDFSGALRTHHLTGHDLGVELKLLRRAAKAIEYRLSGLEEQAAYEIKSGKPVTFFSIEQGKGRERWKKDTPAEQIIMMGDLMGVNIRKPVELDTPAQVRKKGIDESVTSLYTEVPLTGLKLVETDGNNARQIFGKG